MSAALLPLALGGLFLLASRAKAALSSSPDEDRGDRDGGIDGHRGKKKHVRVERRPAKRAKLQPPLKPAVAAKRIKVAKDTHARATAVAVSEKVTAKRAAIQLRGFLRLTGNYGLPTPAPRIAELQKLLGVPATGQIDTATRARCIALGVPLPGVQLKPKATTPVTRATTRTARGLKLERHEAVKPDKGRAPRFEAQGKSVTPAMVAQRLADHFKRSGSPGFKGAPSADVARAQRSMGAGLDVDGLYGDKTRAAGVALGVSLPARAQTVAAFKAAHGEAAKPAAAAATPKAAADPALAARALGAYLDKGGSPGTRAAPAIAVRDAQRGMGGGIAVDGIYGDQTRGRAAALGVKLGPRAQYVKAG